MRIDIVSIFPDFFTNLELSLVGRARDSGLLDLRAHDLRDWTTDRHRTVDDTPYGGGAGMVMKPEPWGDALDSLVGSADGRPTIVVPTPSGLPFTQTVAQDLAARPHLVFACGRYEGIDQRVVDHYRTRDDVAEVCEISIGDYVLNGGESAVVVMLEAAVRLIPGFMGNPGSLTEESHGADGLLEYPVYTKPRQWRGLDVPEALFSGNHAQIAQWRHDQARRRTAERRPDLLHGSGAVVGDDLPDLDVRVATPGDAGELLVLQRACWADRADDVGASAVLGESVDDVRQGIDRWQTIAVRAAGRLVASVRARREADAWLVGRLMVAPDLAGRGLGRRLLAYAEELVPSDVTTFQVRDETDRRHARLLKKAGYRPDRAGYVKRVRT